MTGLTPRRPMNPQVPERSFSVLLVILLATVQVSAQRPLPSGFSAGLQVKITLANERPVGRHIRVDLLTPTGISIQQQFTDADGQAYFVVDLSRAPFEFYVRASGKDIEETTSDLIHFDSNMERGSTKIVRLAVKSTKEPAPQSNQPVTSVAQSQAPKEARNALRNGLTAWEKKNYQQAAEYFEKATAIYPQYDEAFNYLGMMYARLDQPEESRAAFETAVELNDKNASADRNLAGIVLREKDYARAEELARKSLSIEPANAVSLTILAIAELQTGNFDEAIRYARQAHMTPHEGYALCHFVAGQAFERKHNTTEAQVEYKVYLAETPNGPEAEKVRQALERVSLASGPQ